MKIKFALVVCLLLALMTGARALQVMPLKPGQTAPALGGKVLLGGPAGKFDLSQFKGKVVVIDFWATWCGPCLGQFPHINELTEKYKGKPVQFVAVSIDIGQDAEAKIRRLLDQRPLKPMVVLADPSVQKSYGLEFIPTTVLIDKTGKIDASFHTSELAPAAIDRLLGGKASGLARDVKPVSRPESPETPPLFSVSIRKSASESKGFNFGPAGFKQFGITTAELAASINQVSVSRVLTEGDLPTDKWDIEAQFPQGLYEKVRPHISALAAATVGFTFRKEVREIDVYVLKCPSGPKIGKKGELKATQYDGSSSISTSGANIVGSANQVYSLIPALEAIYNAPVIDESGLTGHFDFRFNFVSDNLQSLSEALNDAGLTVTKEKRSIEVVIVKKA